MASTYCKSRTSLGENQGARDDASVITPATGPGDHVTDTVSETVEDPASKDCTDEKRTSVTSVQKDTEIDDPVGVESNAVHSMARVVVDVRSQAPGSSCQTMNSLLYALGSFSTSGSYSFCRPWSRLLSSSASTLCAGAKTTSAGLYVFDYVSNVLVLREYYILGTEGKYDGRANVNFIFSGLGIFYACLALMLFDRVVVAVAFKLKLAREEHPLRSAFFLPIVQFRRFLSGLSRSGSSSSTLDATESLQTESLYAIMSAMGTGPQLVLQSAVVAVAGSTNYYDEYGHERQWSPSAILVLSIIASCFSASYNVGRAIMYQLSKKWTFILSSSGIAGGLYTIGVVFLRCSAVVPIIQNSRGWFIIVYTIVGIGLCSHVNGWLVCFSKKQKMCSWIVLVDVLLIGYMSATIGPLYSMMEDVESTNYKPKYLLSMCVGLVVGINMLPDVVALITLSVLGSTPCHIGLDSHSVTLNCSCFLGFLVTGVALSILPCFILFYLIRSNSSKKCEKHLDEVPNHSEIIVDL